MLLFLPTFSKRKRGFAYIDLIIAVGILTILTATLFTLVITTYQTINFTRTRTSAKHLAREKIELIRNLPFSDIGTVNGIPNGNLPQTETIVRNGQSYLVRTSVVYVDDPFDGSAPNDLLPTDYKRARVDVSWGDLSASRSNPVTIITDIVPKGVESLVGGGTLSILVFNANGLPVQQADVTIVSSSINPPVNLNLKTSTDGRLILPGTPSCITCYQITVTKTGYSTDRTYGSSDVANPNKPHATVLDGQLTEISFTIDQTSALTVSSVSNRILNFSSIPNITFAIRGEKTLGTDVNDEPVYKFSQNITTDGSGNFTLSNLEWDNYHINLPSGAVVDISGTNPLTPLTLLPSQSSQIKVSLTPHSNNSLLVAFTDSSKNPIASVSAKLSGGVNDLILLSGKSQDPDFGQVFFSNLNSQMYHLLATQSAYLDFNEDLPISGQVQEKVTLSTP